MFSINSYTARVGTSLLQNLWLSLWLRIPDRCKRLFVLTSLYAHLKGCTEDDVAELMHVNRELALSRDPNALRFPALIAPMLWKHILPIHKIDPEQSEHYIAKLLRKTPCWLMYADYETRQEDLRRLFKICAGQRCPTAGV